MRIRVLLLSAAFTLAVPSIVGAVAPTDISIETYDGVELRGKFYAANNSKNKNNACVILLHGFQKDPTKGDWVGLANLLSVNGFNVVQFDFRFHGQRTVVQPAIFWNDNFNKSHVTGANRRPPPSELTFKDIRNPNTYYPMLVNDIMAVRTYLDAQNDSGKVNTSSVYLIGTGDAVCLGFFYIAAEWYREREVPNVAVPPLFVSSNRRIFLGMQPCGRDIAGAIWISPVRHPAMSQSTIENFTTKYPSATPMREETPMLFIHGEKDAKSKEGSKFFFEKVLVAQPKSNSRLAKLPQTFQREIKGTQLAEAELFGKNLGTEEMIVKYLEEVDKERKSKVQIAKRGYTKPLGVQLSSFGVVP